MSSEVTGILLYDERLQCTIYSTSFCWIVVSQYFIMYKIVYHGRTLHKMSDGTCVQKIMHSICVHMCVTSFAYLVMASLWCHSGVIHTEYGVKHTEYIYINDTKCSNHRSRKLGWLKKIYIQRGIGVPRIFSRGVF